jgi:hypothetical protein
VSSAFSSTSIVMMCMSFYLSFFNLCNIIVHDVNGFNVPVNLERYAEGKVTGLPVASR